MRKEFIPLATHEADYEAELRNLSILNHLQHPNIIEILSAFTYQGCHNLLFPLKDGDLATMMETPRPAKFESDAVVVIAACRLASALNAVHEFTSDTLDLRLIGCHHDLKPKNILIDGDTFVLADFGLSRLKSVSKGSKSFHRRGQGDYLAPECEDLEGDFQKHTVSRASDIWSFGCILAELLIYIKQGPEEVEAFWKARSFRLDQIRYHLFHHGPGQPSETVSDWLDRTVLESPKWASMFQQLAQKMLSVVPKFRPQASVVYSRLKLIAIYAVIQPIMQLYDKLDQEMRDRTDAFDVFIQKSRCKSWQQACGITNEPDVGDISEGFLPEFDESILVLKQLKEALERIVPICLKDEYHLFLSLRHLNNRLMRLLPSSLVHLFEFYMEANVIIETESPRLLQGAGQALKGEPHSGHLQELATIKHMTILTKQRAEYGRQDLEIAAKAVCYLSSVSEASLAELQEPNGDEARPVLVEWINYDSEYVEDLEGRQLLVRVEAIAELLSTTKPAKFNVLDCYKFFHDPQETRFGLVFDYPPHVPHAREHPISLRQIFDRIKSREQVPFLGDRFKLAHTLALSIGEFHKVGWLHKNISSFNVLFFETQLPSSPASIKNPYIIGFDHSRPDNLNSFSTGPQEKAEYLDYQHPEYIKKPQRYRAEFDYYSLGVVLLEIARWKSLSAIRCSWEESSSEDFAALLRSDGLAFVRQTVGLRFATVIENCLGGRLASSNVNLGDDLGNRAAQQGLFQKIVVDELAMCSA